MDIEVNKKYEKIQLNNEGIISLKCIQNFYKGKYDIFNTKNDLHFYLIDENGFHNKLDPDTNFRFKETSNYGNILECFIDDNKYPEDYRIKDSVKLKCIHKGMTGYIKSIEFNNNIEKKKYKGWKVIKNVDEEKKEWHIIEKIDNNYSFIQTRGPTVDTGTITGMYKSRGGIGRFYRDSIKYDIDYFLSKFIPNPLPKKYVEGIYPELLSKL